MDEEKNGFRVRVRKFTIKWVYTYREYLQQKQIK